MSLRGGPRARGAKAGLAACGFVWGWGGGWEGLWQSDSEAIYVYDVELEGWGDVFGRSMRRPRR
jgi:hypothetical protein